MTRWGIPEYRLPYDIIDQDVNIIRSVGVDIRCNVRIGKDITLDELRNTHDVVLLGLGLQLGRATRIPGSDHADVRKAVDLLRQATAGEDFGTPRTAVVIGGGNVAMDIARTLARLQKDTTTVEVQGHADGARGSRPFPRRSGRNQGSRRRRHRHPRRARSTAGRRRKR